MDVLQAKSFSSRKDLERHINVTYGTDVQANKAAGHKITGTKQELAALSLSDRVSVFGVTCEQAEESEE